MFQLAMFEHKVHDQPPTTTPIATTLSPSSSLLLGPDNGVQKVRLRDENYTFMPCISTKAPPRAWERKPTTPFAPRTESHKIWKRCEHYLGMRGSAREKTVCGQRERESRRSVKRRRIGVSPLWGEADESAGGGAFLGTMFVDLNDGEVKRRRKRVISDTSCEDVCLAASKASNAEGDTAGLETRSNVSQCEEEAETSLDPDAELSTGEGDKEVAGSSIIGDQPQRSVLSNSHVATEMGSGSATADTGSVGNDSLSSEKRTRRKTPPSTTPPLAQDPQAPLLNEGADKEYLHAFLTRAKAKKAAGTMLGPQKQVCNEKRCSTTYSPQTRSRTALAALDGNSPSPTKTRQPAATVNKLDGNDNIPSEMPATPPLRKSNRIALPRPQRLQTSTPSTIRFRRSQGTEFVLIQKSEAQQIAIATRSNTRKNKGEAVQPKMKLEALSTQTILSPAKVTRRGKKNNKQVAWDEGLAYFAPEEKRLTDEVMEGLESRTPIKRSRRLAPGRGTPAPRKKMAEAGMEVERAELVARTRTSTRTRGQS